MVQIMIVLDAFQIDTKEQNSVFSVWMQPIIGVPQGSILGSLLFNIFLNDLLAINLSSIVRNFAGDSTLYCCRESTKDI